MNKVCKVLDVQLEINKEYLYTENRFKEEKMDFKIQMKYLAKEKILKRKNA